MEFVSRELIEASISVCVVCLYRWSLVKRSIWRSRSFSPWWSSCW